MSIGVVFALFAFAGVFLLFVGLNQARRAAGGAEDFQARLAAYGVTTAGATQLPPASGFRETLNRLFSPAAERVGRGDAKKGKPSVAEQLGRADLKLRTSEYFMIQIGFAALFMLIGAVRFGFPGGIIQIVALGIVGYLVPGFYVKYRIGKRLRAFNGQLGDTLSLLSNALKAGYSFAQAIDTVAKNAVPPIAEEFARAVREMNLGEILDNIAYTIRERVRIKGEIATLTAQARASGTLITFLPIVLATFMYFVTPTYFRPMFENFIGWILIAIGIFMIFVGNLIIRRVVAIEV